MPSQIKDYQYSSRESTQYGLHYNFNKRINNRKRIEFTISLSLAFMFCFFLGYYFL